MARLGELRQRVMTIRPEVWAAVGCSALLLVYGNSLSALPSSTREQFLLWSNLALMLALLAWALAWGRFSVPELGLDPRSAVGSALFGAVLSLVAAIPPVLFIALTPLVTGEAIEAPEISERSGAGMACFLLFRQPVGTALFEEVAFRGVLYGVWRRAGGDGAALLTTSGTFSLWHLVISSRTVAESGVVSHPVLIAGGVIVSVAALFAGGLIFAWLRWHTRSIAAAAIAHWLIVAFMTIAVWALA